ncbi:cytochrome P450 [Panus rudis PR-1116 ss-1]|nr:cytochrome P450 [Panus rudis PR-1116 ss-1]
MAIIWQAAAALGLLFVLQRAWRIYSTVKAFKDVPKLYTLIEPLKPLASFLPEGSMNPGLYQSWKESETLYRSRNTETIIYVPFLHGDVALHCASPEALKQILAEPFTFTKPNKVLSLNLLGPNLVASVGEQWRRHRKITAPAFDNQSYASVWDVTASLYHQMLESDAWNSADHHFFAAFNQFTTRLALLVISACGFNMHLKWNETPTREGLTNPVDSTIVTVSTSLLEKIALPSWAFKLPIHTFQRINTAFKDFDKFLNAEITAKKTELKHDIHFDGTLSDSNKTVFARVVAASQQEGARGLDQREIIGNLFIFLFAGHETTAHTLVVTLALLGMYPEEQERVYAHIKATIGDSDPTYDQYGALAPILHCFYEALRLYPPAYIMDRMATTDTVLNAPSLTLTRDILVIPKGTEIVLDMIGASRNPRVYPNPSAFMPTRWEVSFTANVSAQDNFLGFSAGPRVCLGKKFASVEAVCFLTYLLRDWKVDIKLNRGETPQQWQQRALNPI